MERESTGTKYMVANCEGSQNPPRAVELRKENKNLLITYNNRSTIIKKPRYRNITEVLI
jgi:hypothetical protein